MVEVIWKTMSSLLKFQLTAAVTFHDVLNGFREGHEMGTLTLKSKLLQQLTAMREAVLLEFFLDLQKAYDALDQDRCLGILAAYGFVPSKIRLLLIYWGRLTMVDTDGGHFGMPFKGYRGATQGNPLYLTILNVVVSAFILYLVTVVATTKYVTEGIGLSI